MGFGVVVGHDVFSLLLAMSRIIQPSSFIRTVSREAKTGRARVIGQIRDSVACDRDSD